MLLVLDGELLLGGQALVLFDAGLGGSIFTDRRQVVLVLTSLLGGLSGVTPVLNLPGAASGDCHRQQDRCERSARASSRHILEEDVMPKAQRLFGLRRPGRSFWHGGRVVMRGAAGGVGRCTGDHLVSRALSLGKRRDRDRFGAAQVGVVLVVLVPAA